MSSDHIDLIARPPRATEHEDEFWGAGSEWTETARSLDERPSTRPRATAGRWWQRTLTAGSSATRTHGRATAARASTSAAPSGIDDTDPLPRDAFLDPRYADDHMDWDTDAWDIDDWDADDWDTDERQIAGRDTGARFAHAGAPAPTTRRHRDWDSGWDVTAPASRRRRAIDPLIARIGALMVVLTLTVSLVIALTSRDSEDDVLVEATPSPSAAAVATAESTAGATAAVGESAPTTADASTPSSTSASASAPAAATAESAASATAPGDGVADADELAADVEPATTRPACADEYELAEGDYWIRIADAADVRLADLLAANGATVNTVLVPGRTICLPAGASTPAPPTTAAPRSTTTSGAGTSTSTTGAPTTAAPTTAAPTTAAPTTAAPTTTNAAPPAAPADVEAIIRSVWPDEIEERALEIAWRESTYVPTARNSCCYGLFQIYWNVHKGWLDDLGITSVDQLYDPATNARAAYALYERAGGFGPWGG